VAINWDKEIAKKLWKQSAEDDSHTEKDEDTFHASSVGQCQRQLFLGKLGMKAFTPKVLGIFQTGTNFHTWIEENFEDEMDGEFEKSLEYEDEETGLVFTGHCDYHDPEEEVVYDFKTRGSFYNLDPTSPKEKYLDQLTVYMKMLGVQRAKLVWINKKNGQVLHFPTKESPHEYFSFSEERWEKIVGKCQTVRSGIQKAGTEIEDKEDIPFDKCSCYSCSKERLEMDQGEVPPDFTMWDDEGEKPHV